MKEKIDLWNTEVKMAKYEEDKKSADEIKKFIEKLKEEKEKLAENGITMTIEEIVDNGYVTRYKVTYIIQNGNEERTEINYIEIPQNVIVAEGQESTTISFTFDSTSYTVERGTTFGEWIAEQNFTNIWEINGYYYQNDTKIEDTFWEVNHESTENGMPDFYGTIGWGGDVGRFTMSSDLIYDGDEIVLYWWTPDWVGGANGSPDTN